MKTKQQQKTNNSPTPQPSSLALTDDCQASDWHFTPGSEQPRPSPLYTYICKGCWVFSELWKHSPEVETMAGPWSTRQKRLFFVPRLLGRPLGWNTSLLGLSSSFIECLLAEWVLLSCILSQFLQSTIWRVLRLFFIIYEDLDPTDSIKEMREVFWDLNFVILFHSSESSMKGSNLFSICSLPSSLWNIKLVEDFTGPFVLCWFQNSFLVNSLWLCAIVWWPEAESNLEQRHVLPFKCPCL